MASDDNEANPITSGRRLNAQEEHFLDVAFTFAREALAAQEVPVGCIFVRRDSNEIIARGRNEVNESRNATRHAEIVCVDEVVQYCDERNLPLAEMWPKIDVYVTVEPCIMCAAALYALSIRSIVFGCRNDRFGGQTVLDVADVVPTPKTLLAGGYRADEAMHLLKAFYKGTNPSAPTAKAKRKTTN